MRAIVWAVLCIVWGLAIAVKGLRTVRTGEPYVFSMWDGGLLRAGKQLSPLGARIKIGVGVSMALAALVLMSGLVPYMLAAGALIAAVVVSIGSDFVHASDPGEGID